MGIFSNMAIVAAWAVGFTEHPDQNLRQAYADVLQSNHWDFYSTVTYRVQRRDPIRAAGRYWDVLSNKFAAERAFIAVEDHRLGGIHLHALSSHELRPGLQAQTLWRYCEKAFGRYSAEAPRAASAAVVSSYCAKYVTKGGGLDNYHFFGDNWETYGKDHD